MAKKSQNKYFSAIGAAVGGMLIFAPPAAGIAFVLAMVGALFWNWPFFTTLLWTFGVIWCAGIAVAYVQGVTEKPKPRGGYVPGYQPNPHKIGTQEYYLNEIMNQQAMENDDRRLRRQAEWD